MVVLNPDNNIIIQGKLCNCLSLSRTYISKRKIKFCNTKKFFIMPDNISNQRELFIPAFPDFIIKHFNKNIIPYSFTYMTKPCFCSFLPVTMVIEKTYCGKCYQKHIRKRYILL